MKKEKKDVITNCRRLFDMRFTKFRVPLVGNAIPLSEY